MPGTVSVKYVLDACKVSYVYVNIALNELRIDFAHCDFFSEQVLKV